MSKTILVSGANGNLGKAVVDYFLKKGTQVIGLVHHKENAATISNYAEFEVDLTDESATQKNIEQILKEYKHIDTAVLTTGGFATGNFKQTGKEELRKQYALNFETAYFVVRALLINSNKEKTTKIFFIGSEPGMDTSKGKGVVAYALAKSQLFQLAKLLNADSKNNALQAYVVVPTTIDTPQNRKAVPDADFGKWQKPADIAKVIGNYSENPSKDKEIILLKEELK